jgi:hypothetical protein
MKTEQLIQACAVQCTVHVSALRCGQVNLRPVRGGLALQPAQNGQAKRTEHSDLA